MQKQPPVPRAVKLLVVLAAACFAWFGGSNLLASHGPGMDEWCGAHQSLITATMDVYGATGSDRTVLWRTVCEDLYAAR